MIPFSGELLLVGRILFAAIFIYNGYNNVTNPAMVDYADSHDIPFPAIAAPLGGITILLGGFGILLGAFKVLSAIALVGFLVTATPFVHDFWTLPEGERVNQFNHFMKNVAMTGGGIALLVLADGDWAYALNVGLF